MGDLKKEKRKKDYVNYLYNFHGADGTICSEPAIGDVCVLKVRVELK